MRKRERRGVVSLLPRPDLREIFKGERERELKLERERVGARREKPKEEGECSPA